MYRELFIATYFEYKIEAYRWIQLTEAALNKYKKKYKEQKKVFLWNTADKYPRKDKKGYMYKYHVYVVDNKEMYDEFVTENKQWGRNRSVRHQNKKPIMLHGHDEVSVKQYSTQSKDWYFEGKGSMLPKSDGATSYNEQRDSIQGKWIWNESWQIFDKGGTR